MWSTHKPFISIEFVIFATCFDLLGTVSPTAAFCGTGSWVNWSVLPCCPCEHPAACRDCSSGRERMHGRCVTDRTLGEASDAIIERMFLSLRRKLMNIRACSPTEPTDGSRDRRLVALFNEARSEQEQLQIARGH